MNFSLQTYNKIFENKVRLQVMSVLMVNEEVDFNELKELLQVTDGNLASNLKTLEKENYIEIHKSFVNRKPNTRYKRTETGEKAFENHLSALEEFIKQQK